MDDRNQDQTPPPGLVGATARQLPRHPSNVDYREKSSGTVTCIIGQGEGRPKSHRLSKPIDIAHHDGRLYVADRGNDRIMLYDMDGSHGREVYRMESPRYVAISDDGQFMFVIGQTSLRKATLDDGVCVAEFSALNETDFGDCWALCCHDDHVTVLCGRTVSIFTQNLDHVRRFIVLRGPVAMCVGDDWMVYVAGAGGCVEAKNIPTEGSSLVQVYNRSGEHVRTFGEGGWIFGISVDGDGNVLVSRFFNHRIDVYNPQGQLIITIGSPGQGPRQFKNPVGLCLLPDGRLGVADAGNDRVQIF